MVVVKAAQREFDAKAPRIFDVWRLGLQYPNSDLWGGGRGGRNREISARRLSPCETELQRLAEVWRYGYWLGLSARSCWGEELDPHDSAEPRLRKLEHRFGIGPKVGVYAQGAGGEKRSGCGRPGSPDRQNPQPGPLWCGH